MQRIVPNKLTSGSIQSAFDDVNVDDPDFLYIQCKFHCLLYGIKPRKLFCLRDKLHYLVIPH
jgi:hypothetical protein